jgi:hypothetical protein
MRFCHSLSASIFSNLNSYKKSDNAQPTNIHQIETKINAPMYISNEGVGLRGEITIRNTLRVPRSAITIQSMPIKRV